jgi:mannose-6-phosphate isomerase-like protein (cupin superfamily)
LEYVVVLAGLKRSVCQDFAITALFHQQGCVQVKRSKTNWLPLAAGHGGRPAPHPLMHRSQTIDYGIILSGEIWLVLDDSEILCKAGDVIVQRGTSHAWSNRSDCPCRIAFVLIDAKFSEELTSKF